MRRTVAEPVAHVAGLVRTKGSLSTRNKTARSSTIQGEKNCSPFRVLITIILPGYNPRRNHFPRTIKSLVPRVSQKNTAIFARSVQRLLAEIVN